jgi:hypothetical protein
MTETAVETTQSDVAVPEPAGATEERQAAVLTGLFDPDMDFRKLALEANYHAKGFRLVDSKDYLVGVPFIVTAVTYREGYSTPQGPGDYISIEGVVADKATLESSPTKHYLPAEMGVYPNEPIVVNDGGTGIRRTLTQLFHEIGIIDVGPELEGENRFDRPYQTWASGAERATTGITSDLNGEPFRYIAVRGLHRSDYDSPYGPATTFYIG